MKTVASRILSLALCTALFFTVDSFERASPAQAGGRGAVAAGVAGFAIGVIAGSAISRSQPRHTQRPRANNSPPRSRQQARRDADVVAVQKALAHFDFYKGPIDGIAGRGTRGAISSLQAQMGWPVTGRLSDDQKTVLLSRYANALAGGSQPGDDGKVDRLFAMINGGGGAAAGAAVGTGFAPIPAAGVTASGAASATLPTAPQASRPEQPAYRLHCSDDGAPPAPAGGLTLASGASLVPAQFCNARAAALVRSAEALSSVADPDLSAITAECARISDALAGHRARLVGEAPQAIEKAMQQEFAGLSQEQKATAATSYLVCLGIGYAHDNAEMVASATLGLLGAGQSGYGELLGAAFALGLGVPQNEDGAVAWIEHAAAAIEDGAEPVAPGAGVERASILHLVALELAGKRGAPVLAANDAPDDAPDGAPDAAPAVLASSPAVPASSPAVPASSPAVPASSPIVMASSQAGDAASRTEAATAPAETPAAQAAQAAGVEIARLEPAGEGGDRRAAAEPFFAAESASQAAQIDTLLSQLALDRQEVEKNCRGELEALVEGRQGGAGMMMRVCRSWSYAAGERYAMYWFDRQLADSGDADAQPRLLKHLLLGNDRKPIAAQ